MKLSIFTTMSEPDRRGDAYNEALDCYSELADEIVLVNGDTKRIALTPGGWHLVYQEWPQEFSWEFIGQQFQRGYEACTGDWVIHADLDFIFHETDFQSIREAFEAHPDAPALSFYKYQFIQPDEYNLKSRLVIAVNKGKYGDRIRFDSGGDLCQPSLDGKELKPEDVPESKLAFYNYEKLIKTEAQIRDDVGRMARAWQRHFGTYKLGGPDDESAWQAWLRMVQGRYSKPQTPFAFDNHPKYVKEVIRNLTPQQWGGGGFGLL